MGGEGGEGEGGERAIAAQIGRDRMYSPKELRHVANETRWKVRG